ncbi:MAG: transcription elongation factor GreA [Phycisphaerales bacterium JB061]|jgi:transcription elongation factor GreA
MELITAEEKAQLEKRLKDLRDNRPRISERIAEARALGDLKENAEYHAAREQQGMEEAEIRRLEEKLQHAQVIDSSKQAAGVVFIGSIVRLKDLKRGDDDTYRLVGELSGNAMSEHVEVSVNSPMGQALLKSRVGEVIRVDAPRGVKQFEIVELL